MTVQTKNGHVRTMRQPVRGVCLLALAAPAVVGDQRAACERLRAGWVDGGCARGDRRGCRFVHIPKTGGSSLRTELEANFGLSLGSKEACFWDEYLGRRPDANLITLLRAPRQHVLSQYAECGWSHFGRKHTAAYAVLVPDAPPFPGANASHGLRAWLAHFADDGWTYGGSGDWDCYNPSNMQARALTCGGEEFEEGNATSRKRRRATAEGYVAASLAGHRSNAHHVKYRGVGVAPPLARALEALEKTDHVGLTELYHESLCLLVFRIDGKLPPGCACDAERRPPHEHQDKGVPRHGLSDLDADTTRLADALTAVDAPLYITGLRRVLRDLGDLEVCSGTRVLCASARDALRDATAYLLDPP